MLGDGEPLQESLPSTVFASWRNQFSARYPESAQPAPEYSWRAAKAIQTAMYTRQVDTIYFRSLAEFRGGFANEGVYNFWTGNLDRHSGHNGCPGHHGQHMS